ncbi:MAG: dTMP kinase [Methylobacteriaceae bacterium]|jgi:dTMP kinase|nr:dTMP kinase [Methylobacteriaceae bacterium]
MTDQSNGSGGSARRGRFITFEGGEGAGKSTQVRRLVSRLEERGIEVIATREPGGSRKAEALRDVLLSGAAARFGAAGEAILFSAARIDHVDNMIAPALARGAWVVSDRFADSTRAYQGVLGKLDRRFILALERIAIAHVRPDLTIFLDIPAEAGLLRISNRRKGEPADRFEAEGIQFHNDLRNAFREIARAEPERCVSVNGLAPEDQVAAAVWSEVETRLLGDAALKPRRTRRKQVTEKRA